MGKVILDNEYALLTYNKDHKLLELEWKTSSPEHEYRKVFDTAVDLASVYKIDYFLSDIRKGGAISLANLQWLKKNVILKAIELDLKKIALILNDELYSRIYADSIRKSLLRSKVKINFFTMRNEAIEWFSSDVS
ncbi:MAG: hypothetical protein JXB34_13840 [Bacteroidales bacterium]|nr:hypothetical protein [Bacteroidales bacterium]